LFKNPGQLNYDGCNVIKMSSNSCFLINRAKFLSIQENILEIGINIHDTFVPADYYLAYFNTLQMKIFFDNILSLVARINSLHSKIIFPDNTKYL